MRYRNSIVIPAKNEAKRLGKTLKAFCKYFQNKHTEIIVVVNNSSDQTINIALKYQKLFSHLKVIKVTKPNTSHTKGLAVKVGIEKANGYYIGFVDADGSTWTKETHRLLEELHRKRYDGIIANRYHKDSKLYPAPTLFRKVISKGLNIIVKTLFSLPYRDTQCGAKFFTKNVAKSIAKNLLLYGWAFDIDVLYYSKKNDYKIKEIPTVWGYDENSTLNYKKAIPAVFFSLIKLRYLYLRKDFLNSPFIQDKKYQVYVY